MENAFTPQFIQEQKELAAYIQHQPWTVHWVEGVAYLMNVHQWQMARFTLGTPARAVCAAINHYPAALDQIELLNGEIARLNKLLVDRLNGE